MPGSWSVRPSGYDTWEADEAVTKDGKSLVAFSYSRIRSEEWAVFSCSIFVRACEILNRLKHEPVIVHVLWWIDSPWRWMVWWYKKEDTVWHSGVISTYWTIIFCVAEKWDCKMSLVNPASISLGGVGDEEEVLDDGSVPAVGASVVIEQEVTVEQPTQHDVINSQVLISSDHCWKAANEYITFSVMSAKHLWKATAHFQALVHRTVHDRWVYINSGGEWVGDVLSKNKYSKRNTIEIELNYQEKRFSSQPMFSGNVVLGKWTSEGLETRFSSWRMAVAPCWGYQGQKGERAKEKQNRQTLWMVRVELKSGLN